MPPQMHRLLKKHQKPSEFLIADPGESLPDLPLRAGVLVLFSHMPVMVEGGDSVKDGLRWWVVGKVPVRARNLLASRILLT